MNRLPCIITYHPKISSLPSILRNNYYNIIENSDAKNILPEPPLVAYKQSKNLKSFLVHTKLDKNRNSIDLKNNKCNRPRCKTCPIITTNDTFVNTISNKHIKIKNGGNCTTKNCIYAITCSECSKVNIGQTGRSISDRISGHRSDIKQNKLGNDKFIETAEHFKEKNHSTYTVSILNSNPNWNINDRLFFEDLYIAKLKTLHPYGINKRHNDLVKYFYSII